MTELGYPRHPGSATMSASVLQSSAQLRTGGSHHGNRTPTSRPGCCDPSSPVALMSDPRASLSICTCGLPNCTRLPGGSPPEGVFPSGLSLSGGPMSGPMDPGVLYGLGGAYGMKECPEVFRGLPHLGGYYPYDAGLMYPYMNGYGGIDARRKNATKESTNTLKAWLYEHRKNPYPTKGEKIMLAILTKMTLTQVSTWFANARRRLKKENKMTWASKEGEDDDDDDDDVDRDDNDDMRDVTARAGDGSDVCHFSGDDADDKCDIDIEDIGADSGTEGSSADHIIARLRRSHEMSHSRHLSSDSYGSDVIDRHRSLKALAVNGDPHRDTRGRPDSESEQIDSSILSRDSLHSGLSPHSPHKSRRVSPERERNSPCPANSTCNSTKSEASTSNDRRPRSASIVPITPPPSPKKDKSQSPSRSHISRQSAGTIHHYATVSPSSRTSGHSPQSDAKRPTTDPPAKPKIWSIADVMNSKPSTPAAGGAASGSGGRPPFVDRMSMGLSERLHPGGPLHGSSPLSGHHASPYSRHGHPSAQGSGLGHVLLPGAQDGHYGVAFYPYGLPHPAAHAAALMASQRGVPLPGQGNPSLLAAANHSATKADYRVGPRPGNSLYARPSPLHPLGVPPLKASPEPQATDSGVTRFSAPGASTSCSPTAFKPVAQRQA